MSGRKSEEAYYAYLDGKHQATWLIEKYNQTYDLNVYTTGCREWELTPYMDDFLKGVKEAYDCKDEIYKIGYKKSFPKAVRIRSSCNSTNQESVSDIWDQMYK